MPAHAQGDSGVHGGRRFAGSALFIRKHNNMRLSRDHNPVYSHAAIRHGVEGDPKREVAQAVQLVQTINDLLPTLHSLRSGGKKLALVPTMGALHDGHMALVARAATLADHVAVSIFVNPKQFGPNEDFDAYPRPADADTKLLRAANVKLLWMPSVAEMYPTGFATTVSVSTLPDRLCGALRPGHFNGVTTVVSKLLTQLRPDYAVFGEKDWQQLAIIRRMTIDLNLGVEIIGEPTQRADDGLALSSRNAYLTGEERQQAAALNIALRTAAAKLEAGDEVPQTLTEAREAILAGGFQSVDYVEFVDALTLEPLDANHRQGRLIAAARLGKTRLIDNFHVAPRPA